ncbi:MAG TPA: phosphodiesterase [Actinocrinis sp.]|nr:phosphodiesterase [Actinocrinis sp.]
MVLLAQISDLHFDGTAATAERVSRVLDYLKAMPTPVDAVLVTGDIADTGAPAEYAQAAQVLTADFPILTLPGNHDDRAEYRRGLLGEPAADGPANRAHLIGGTAILMCDSSVPGQSPGRLAAETLAWLAETLEALPAGTPVLLAFHHPPVVLHHPILDAIRLENPQELADLLDGRPEVVAVLTGHAHTAAVSTFAGRPLVVAPGVYWTLQLPWEGDKVVDRPQPPAIAFHVLDDEHRLTTHYRAVL